jgi:hypothetical protein
MNAVKKLVLITMVSLVLPSVGLAAIIEVPDYADIVNASTTAFGQALFTDLLPWAGAIALIVIAAMLLMKLRTLVTGGVGKALGAGRRRRGGRRRYR